MSISTEINHTSPPSLGLRPSQGSLLPYTRSVVYLGLGQRKFSVLWETRQQHFNRVQWCCASLQSKLNMNSISDRSIRRTSSRLVIIRPVGIQTYHHCWWILVGDFFRTASRQHLPYYSLHQTTSSEFIHYLAVFMDSEGRLLPLEVSRVFATASRFPWNAPHYVLIELGITTEKIFI